MIKLLHLSKLVLFAFFFIHLTLNSILAEDEPADIWADNEISNTSNSIIENKKEKKTKSIINLEDGDNLSIQINEDKIEDVERSVIGIFDPEENNFNLNMWSYTDGEQIKKTLKRINKLKLSQLSEDLLFKILFTNAYPPLQNLTAKDFLDIKIDWIIKNKRIRDLEILLENNQEVGENSKAIQYLINEYLSSADIRSACEKVKFINKNVKSKYLEKFTIYCLINDNRKNEAQLIYDLLIEEGFKDKFFEEKINFLFGITSTTDQKILDNNLFNFYLSYITNDDFKYQPTDLTDKYIWRFLSSANLIQVNDFEDDEIILTYEQAASQNAFDKDEIFKIYLKMNFNFNQLVNANEIYKTLPNYKARALIYQSILLSDQVERKINLAFLLKDLFKKDKIFNVYVTELSRILKSINLDEIPKDYIELVEENLEQKSISKVKFNNDILHRSKVIKHFLENNEKISRTEKDLKLVYKKIKKNKKYFISIKDIVVLESLKADGVSLPKDLNYTELSSELTIPQNLEELADQNQLGLVMLKIVEIIGEDEIKNLDPETVYFINKILNKLNLKKIRNNILSEALPSRV